MCPPDPIVVTVDIVSSPSPLVGSTTIRSVASTSEAVQLAIQGPKGDTGPTVLGGTTGSIQFRYGSGLSASAGFYLAPVDPNYETAFNPFSPIPSQPSITDTLRLVAATGSSGGVYEITPMGLAFHRHLLGEFDDTGGSVIEAVGSIYDGEFTWGNNLIIRASGEGESGHKGHIRIFDAHDTLAYEVSNDDTGALYQKFYGDVAVNANFSTAVGYGVTFGGPISAPNIVYSINGASGSITNVAKTDVAQTFTGTQYFPNGISASGLTANTAYFDGNINATKSVILNTNAANTLTVNGVSTFNQGISISKGSQLTGANVVGSVAITGGELYIRAIRLGRGNFPTNATGPDYNLAIGESALNSVVPNSPAFLGIFNVAIGYNSMRVTTSGGYNTAMGGYTLFSNTSGAGNVAIGANSLLRNTTASHNNGFGSGALYNTTVGQFNTAVGNLALNRNIGGERNVAVGFRAGFASSIPPSLPGGNISQDSTANPLSLSGANNSIYIGF